MNKENELYMQNGILFGYKEIWNPAILKKWMELEDIISSEMGNAQKDKYCMFFSYVEAEKKPTWM